MAGKPKRGRGAERAAGAKLAPAGAGTSAQPEQDALRRAAAAAPTLQERLGALGERLCQRPLWVVFLVALVVRSLHFAFVAAGDPFFAQPALDTDAETYWKFAKSIAGGDVLLRELVPGAFYYGPLYAYFLAPLIRVFGESFVVVHVVQWAMGLAVPVLVGDMARRVSGNGAALGAGVMVALAPELMFWSQTLLMEGLIVLLVSGALWCVVRATLDETELSARARLILWGGAGVLLGITCTGRANVALPMVALIIMRAWRPLPEAPAPAEAGPGWKGVLRRRAGGAVLASAMAVGAALPMSTAVARNLWVAKRFAITTNGPALLYIGNCKEAIGVLTSTPRIEALMKEYHGFPPWGPMLRQEIQEDPMHLLKMQVTKARIFFNAYDAPDNFSLDLLQRFSPMVQWNPLGWTAILALGSYGLWLLRRRLLSDLWPLTVFLVVFPLSIIPVLVVGRYRLPWLLPLWVCSGAALAHLGTLVVRQGWFACGRFAAYAAALCVVMLPRWNPASVAITPTGLPPRVIRPNDYVMLARGLELAKKGKEASAALLKEGALAQPEVPFLVKMATGSALELQRHADVVSILGRYLALYSNDVDTAVVYAVALANMGQREQALSIANQILKAVPGHKDAAALKLQLERQRSQ